MAENTASRFEFRCWPVSVEPYAPRLHENWTVEGEDRREDTYLLPIGETRYLPKIRGLERFEVKRLMMSDSFLEKWTVAFSEPFPIAERKTDLLQAFFPGADLGGVAIETPADALQALKATCLVRRVAKRRTRFKQGACRGEITRARVGRLEAASVAIECEDREKALDALRSLDLTGLQNLNYGAWLNSADRVLLRHG